MIKFPRICLVAIALVIPGCAGVPGDGARTHAQQARQEAVREAPGETGKLPAPKSPPAPAGQAGRTISVANDPMLGSAGAPLTIIEYTDYQCPYCGRHARAILPQIQKRYIDTGKVRYVLQDFPLSFHGYAAKAAEAAHCAGDQGKYWAMHDQLFANQGNLDKAALREYAQAIGLDAGAFNACLDSGKYTGRVDASKAQGLSYGVRGTPSFVIGHTDGDSVRVETGIRGAVGYETLEATLEKMLQN
jgi:protein-disulfide isomerase